MFPRLCGYSGLQHPARHPSVTISKRSSSGEQAMRCLGCLGLAVSYSQLFLARRGGTEPPCPCPEVSIDGSHVRDAHTGFQQVLKHGIENEVIHADAWTKLKATKHLGCDLKLSPNSPTHSSSAWVQPRHVERLKEEIFELAVRNRSFLKLVMLQMHG